MINKCEFIGRLGADPTVGTTETGVKYAKMNIACDEKGYTKADGTKVEDRTEWIPVVMWRGLAETAEKFLKKGALVYIEGKFRTQMYEKDGEKRWSSSIVADTMKMLDSRREEAPKPVEPGTAPVAQPRDFSTDDKDDLPF